MRIAGWALGLSMVVAGIGVAVGASQGSPMETKAAETTDLYTFNSASWGATKGGSAANWTSGKAGAGFNNNGIQVTTSATGANGTSPVSYTNISKVVLTYNTNKSGGAGTADIKIGSNEATSKNWAYSSGDGRSANYTLQYDYATPQSGYIKITLNTTTNSIYLVSCAITFDNGVAATYSVTYNGNGNTSGSAPSTVSGKADGATVTVAGAGDLAKTHYAFNGWNTSADGNGDKYAAGATLTINKANVTLYAQWSQNEFSVTYDANGATSGTVPTDNTWYAANASVTVLGNTGNLAKPHSTFDGWTLVKDDSEAVGATITMGSANVTLYAKWIEEDSIVKNQDSYTLTKEDTLDLRECVTVTGPGALTFSVPSNDYVSLDVDGYTLSGDAVGGPVTITATKGSETPVTFTVTVIDPNDGSEEKPFTVGEALQCADDSVVWMTGFVKSHNAWESGFNNFGSSFIVSSDLKGQSGDEILCYRVTTGENITLDDDQMAENGLYGYRVKIHGTISTYKGNKQFSQGSTIESVTAYSVQSIGAVAADKTYYTGSHFSESDLTVTATYDNIPDGVINASDFTITVNGKADTTLKEGDNEIEVSYDGKTATVHVTGTTKHANEIVIDDTKTVYIGNGSVQIDYLLDPEDATDTITWSTNHPEIATVDANGAVTGVSAGEAIITATVNGHSDTCTVTVANDSVLSLGWTKRGTVDCFAGAKMNESAAYAEGNTYSDWTFTVTWASGKADNPVVGTGENDIHVGLYDTSNPTSEGTPLAIDHAFTAAESGKYLVAYYKGTKTVASTNRTITVTERLNSIMEPVSGTEDRSFSISALNGTGTSGTGSAVEETTSNDLTVSATLGYGASISQFRVYANGTITVKSEYPMQSVTITVTSGAMTKTSGSSGDKEWVFRNNGNAQAKVSGISAVITVSGEREIANKNLVAQKAALEFAKNFSSRLDGICAGDSTDLDDLQAAWNGNVQGKVSCKKAYQDALASLGDNETNIAAFKALIANVTPKDATEESGDTLQDAIRRYNWIVLQRGMEDFLTDTGKAQVTSLPASTGALGQNTIANSSAAVVSAVAVSGLIAATGYFFLRKKKEN